MIEYDEYGRPIPHIYGGNRARSTNPILAEHGINTEGPLAEQAAQTAQNYAPPLYDEGGQVRHMPQQYGQAGSVYNPDEGPLSPQATADAMPSTSGGMEQLIKKHLLPMHPALKQLSKEGYQNHLKAKREAEAAQKQQRMQQQEMNAPGPTQPSVQNIGGYNFVRGMWRRQNPDEAAQTQLLQAKAQNELAEPSLKMADIASRGMIARTTAEARAKENEANRGIQQSRLAETNRHNTASEATANARETRFSEQEKEKRLGIDMEDLNDIVADLQEREGIAREKAEAEGYGWYNPKGWFYNGPSHDQFMDYVRVKGKPGEFIEKKGSYAAHARRGLNLFNKLKQAGKGQGSIPDEVIEFMEELNKKYPATKPQ